MPIDIHYDFFFLFFSTCFWKSSSVLFVLQTRSIILLMNDERINEWVLNLYKMVKCFVILNIVGSLRLASEFHVYNCLSHITAILVVWQKGILHSSPTKKTKKQKNGCSNTYIWIRIPNPHAPWSKISSIVTTHRECYITPHDTRAGTHVAPADTH